MSFTFSHITTEDLKKDLTEALQRVDACTKILDQNSSLNSRHSVDLWWDENTRRLMKKRIEEEKEFIELVRKALKEREG